VARQENQWQSQFRSQLQSQLQSQFRRRQRHLETANGSKMKANVLVACIAPPWASEVYPSEAEPLQPLGSLPIREGGE